MFNNHPEVPACLQRKTGGEEELKEDGRRVLHVKCRPVPTWMKSWEAEGDWLIKANTLKFLPRKIEA